MHTMVPYLFYLFLLAISPIDSYDFCIVNAGSLTSSINDWFCTATTGCWTDSECSYDTLQESSSIVFSDFLTKQYFEPYSTTAESINISITIVSNANYRMSEAKLVAYESTIFVY